MPRLENEKNLGNVVIELSDRVDKAVIARNNMKKKQFITAAIEFFLALPEAIQDQLLLRPPTSEAFAGLVSQVAGVAKQAVTDRHLAKSLVGRARVRAAKQSKKTPGKLAKS